MRLWVKGRFKLHQGGNRGLELPYTYLKEILVDVPQVGRENLVILSSSLRHRCSRTNPIPLCMTEH
jgi:hypothetical protein